MENNPHHRHIRYESGGVCVSAAARVGSRVSGAAMNIGVLGTTDKFKVDIEADLVAQAGGSVYRDVAQEQRSWRGNEGDGRGCAVACAPIFRCAQVR